MARQSALAVSMIALVLGLLAAGLSFIAYAKRIKVEDVRIDKQGVCIYPGSPSFALGIIAALLILSEQILVSTGTGCFCCGGHRFPSNCCGFIGIILFILSWLAFIITFSGLILSAITYNTHYLISMKNNSSSDTNAGITKTKDNCLIGRETLFLGCGVWCIITLVLALTSFATLVCGRNRNRTKGGHFANEHGVAMG